MNKQELVDAVAAKTGASKASTNEAIDEVFAAIIRAVVAGDVEERNNCEYERINCEWFLTPERRVCPIMY